MFFKIIVFGAFTFVSVGLTAFGVAPELRPNRMPRTKEYIVDPAILAGIKSDPFRYQNYLKEKKRIDDIIAREKAEDIAFLQQKTSKVEAILLQKRSALEAVQKELVAAQAEVPKAQDDLDVSIDLVKQQVAEAKRKEDSKWQEVTAARRRQYEEQQRALAQQREEAQKKKDTAINSALDGTNDALSQALAAYNAAVEENSKNDNAATQDALAKASARLVEVMPQ